VSYKFYCDHESCNRKVFVERLRVAKAYARRSTELNGLILGSSIMTSNEGASQILGKAGIKVSADSIQRMLDHINIKDNPEVKRIGVDDVAKKKNRDYYTIIYDLDTGDIIALLEGRDGIEFRKWLKKHPKIELVARDRDSAFAAAISELLPDAIQVADRFHIIQNLIGYLRDGLKKCIPETLYFKEGKLLEGSVAKAYKLAIPLNSKKLDELEYDNMPPMENGKEVDFDATTRNFESSRYKGYQENVEVKYRRILKIRARYKELEGSKKKSEIYDLISNEDGWSTNTVKKYIKMSEDEVEEKSRIRTIKKPSRYDPYNNMIYKMLRDNVSPAQIFTYVLKKDSTLNWITLRNRISLMAENNFGKKFYMNYHLNWGIPEDIVKWNRATLLKIMTANEKEEKAVEMLGQVKSKYPEVKEIEEMYIEFHSILMGKDETKLEGFLDKHEEGVLSSFVNGIKKDIAAVRNGISREENSGVVEGGNNKFKLIKRIGYGRLGLINLFKKCFLAFKTNSAGFCLHALSEHCSA
jgi:transposase